MTIKCQQCGGTMRKTTKGESSCALQLLALALFFIGLSICITGVGAIIGIPLMLGSIPLGYKRRKVWRCAKCGYTFDRS